MLTYGSKTQQSCTRGQRLLDGEPSLSPIETAATLADMSNRSAPALPGSVLIVTGPPGSGKSTVAPRVADRLGPPSVCLEADWFWTTIVSGFIEPWKPESDDQNQTVLRSVTSAAAEMALGGYHVVIDGVVGPWHLPAATAILNEKRIGLDYIVLRPDLRTCLTRAIERASEPPRVAGHPPLTDSGPITTMWHAFSDLGNFEAHVIDTSGHDSTATVDELMNLRICGRLRIPVE